MTAQNAIPLVQFLLSIKGQIKKEIKMYRFISIIFALFCVTLLAGAAVYAQGIIVDDGTDATLIEGSGVTNLTTTGLPGVTIDGTTVITGTLGVTGAITGDVTGNLTGNVTGGTISGTTINASGMITGTGGADIESADGSSAMFVRDGEAGIGTDNSWLKLNDGGDGEVGGDASAELMVTNAVSGISHGLGIYQDYTQLSGGVNSTTLTLDDDGATFSDEFGDPVTVTGVADGVRAFDAVNRRQLDGVETSLSAGIASIAALSAIPSPVCGKNTCVGVGFGHYNSESAVAVGVKANLPGSDFSVAAGMGFSSNSSPAANAGVSFSF